MMYNLLKADGTFVFEQFYCFDFIMHCLFNIIDSDNPTLRNVKVVSFDLDNVRSNFGPLGRGECLAPALFLLDLDLIRGLFIADV